MRVRSLDSCQNVQHSVETCGGGPSLDSESGRSGARGNRKRDARGPQPAQKPSRKATVSSIAECGARHGRLARHRVAMEPSSRERYRLKCVRSRAGTPKDDFNTEGAGPPKTLLLTSRLEHNRMKVPGRNPAPSGAPRAGS